MFAIIKTGGKQYKVAEGDVLEIETLRQTQGDKVEFENVLMVSNGDELKVGIPFVSGAMVSARILENGKGDKKMVFKYKSKTRQRKKKGHRQPFTKVRIEKISLN